MSKINEQEFIKLYNQGKDDYDLSVHFSCGERTAEKFAQRLRKEGKLAFRKDIVVSSKKAVNIDLEELKETDFEEQKKQAKLHWNIARTKIAANKKGAFKTYVVVGDIHVPEQDDVALNTVFQVMNDVKFDGIINIGDYMDFASISKYNKGKNKTVEGKRIKSDYIQANAILDEFDKRLPKNAKKHFLTGNHEVRVKALIEEYPMLDGLFSFEDSLKLIERGYKVYGHNEIVKFGRLNVVHGIYCGSNPAKSHASKLLSNVLCGHLHSQEIAMIHSPAKEISVIGYINGCLCSMSPDYMVNRPSNWSHGFAILYVLPNGFFDVNLIRIINGKAFVNGKLYDGNKK